MDNKDFTYSFGSSRSAAFIFEMVLDVRKWWYGCFDETITGTSGVVGDVFTFRAGEGMHNTTQKMVELIPYKKVSWLVTDSHLSFLTKTDEWTGTQFSFELLPQGDKTKVTFTHEGLKPEIECYDQCSSGWMQYLSKLEKQLQ